MLLNRVGDLWRSEVWSFLRPTGLLDGLVACYRKILDSFGNTNTNINSIPVGRGQLYEHISVPLSNIGNNRNIAGIGQIFSEEFPYTVVGAPTGILLFSSAIGGRYASIYNDFIEHNGVYYFRSNPLSFGSVNTKNETPECTFVVAVQGTKSNTTVGQDPHKTYAGSVLGYVNEQINIADSERASTNGISTRTTMLIGGITCASTDSKVSNCWREGNHMFAVLSTGELLRCGTLDIDTSRVIGTSIGCGDIVTPAPHYFVYPNGTDGALSAIIVNDPSDSVNISDYPQLLEAAPHLKTLAGLVSPPELSFSTVYSVVKQCGLTTVDIGTPVCEAKTQRTLSTRVGHVSNQYICSLSSIDAHIPAEATGVYLYLSPAANKCPMYYPGISPEAAILRNIPEMSVVRLPIQTTGTVKYVVLNAITSFGYRIDASHCIQFIMTVKLGKKYKEDCILSGNKVNNVPMHAGGCVVLALNNKY